MELKCLSSGSKGNAFCLVDSEKNILLLDAGIPIKDIKIGIDFQIGKVKGALITHHHKDHSYSALDLERMGIKVIAPYVSKPKDTHLGGGFIVAYFPLVDKDGHFVHSNGDSSECAVYGYLIEHDKEKFKLLYVTDCQFIKWRFKNVDNLLIGIDYMDGLVSEENMAKNFHIYSGHLELKTACEFVKVTDRDKTLKNLIVCHMSDSNSDPEKYETELTKVTNAKIQFARKGETYEL